MAKVYAMSKYVSKDSMIADMAQDIVKLREALMWVEKHASFAHRANIEAVAKEALE